MALMQIADNADPDQLAHFAQVYLCLRCSLTESMTTVVESLDTVVYVYAHGMLRSDCTDAHTDLDLRHP